MHREQSGETFIEALLPQRMGRTTIIRVRRALARRGLASQLFAELSTASSRRAACCSSRARCWTPPWSRRGCGRQRRPAVWARYRGRDRHTLELMLKCIAFNLRRADRLLLAAAA